MSPTPAPEAARLHLLIPCGGSGSRAGAGLPKQYREIAGRMVLAHTLVAVAAVEGLDQVLVAVSADEGIALAEVALAQARTAGAWPAPLRVRIVPCAGATRALTVQQGLEQLLAQGASPDDWVLVHDAARCLLLPAQVEALIVACRDDAVGGLLALKLPDTLKQEQGGRVAATLERADKWLAQTPQMFRLGRLLQALLQAGDTVTDESSAIEAQGLHPRLVPGSAQNFKLTYPEDFALAEALLIHRQA